jgi:hypothetical protein
MPGRPRLSDVGSRLAQSHDPVAVLPLPALSKDLDPFETFQDIALADDAAGALEAFVLGHGENFVDFGC